MYALNFYSPIVADQLRTRPQDRDDPARRQVARSTRRAWSCRCSCGARYGPREKIFDAVIDKVEVKAPRGPLAARDRARQPGDPPARGDGRLPHAALQPGRHGGRHRHRDPVLADRQPSRLIRSPSSSSGRRAAPQASHAVAKADANLALQEGQRARIGPAHCGHSTARSCSVSSK